MSGVLGFTLSPGRSERAVRGYDFTGGVLPPGATLARASGGSVVSGPGTVASAGTDVARFDRWPVTALVLEPAATNLVPNSARVSAGWVPDHSGTGSLAPVVTPAAGTAPDGGAADRILFQRSAGFSRMSAAIGAVPAGAAFTFSIWLKGEANAPGPLIRLDGVAGPTLALAPEWRRHALSGVGTGAAVNCQLLVWSAAAGSPVSAALLAWGMQLELGSGATSPIATGGAPATRAADVLTLDWARHGVADGGALFRYQFADGSSAERGAQVMAGRAEMPVPPGGERIVRIIAA